MISPKTKAQQVLSDWNDIKHAHFIHQLKDLNVVLDVEFEKEKLQSLATLVYDALVDTDLENELIKYTTEFENELTKFQEQFLVDFLTTLRT